MDFERNDRDTWLIPKSADNNNHITMKTFGTLLSEARKAKGMSQKELASQVKKEGGQTISPQYLNDIEHGRRNPPSELLIAQIAKLLECDKDTLCLAAGTIPSDLMKMAINQPDRVEKGIKLFRRTVKEGRG
jgi:transcriptional regulator with XRE-family HTH domain